MTNEIIENLKKLAKRETCSDSMEENNIDPPAYYDCGNADDTYAMGVSDGETELARTILKKLNIAA